MVFDTVIVLRRRLECSMSAVRLVASAAALGLLTAAITGCSSSGSPTATASGGDPLARASIGVVAAENFWGDIVSQIGGVHVKVTSIISDPSDDPHEYE